MCSHKHAVRERSFKRRSGVCTQHKQRQTACVLTPARANRWRCASSAATGRRGCTEPPSRSTSPPAASSAPTGRCTWTRYSQAAACPWPARRAAASSAPNSPRAAARRQCHQSPPPPSRTRTPPLRPRVRPTSSTGWVLRGPGQVHTEPANMNTSEHANPSETYCRPSSVERRRLFGRAKQTQRAAVGQRSLQSAAGYDVKCNTACSPGPRELRWAEAGGQRIAA